MAEFSRKIINLGPKNIINRITSKREQYDTNLEELIDPEQDYNRFQTHGLQLLKPELLYDKGYFENTTQFYRNSYETTIQCIKDQVKVLNIISKEGEHNLKQRNFKFIHLGIIVVGVKGLMRKDLGCKVLITLFDERIKDITKSMIASTEIDMNNNRRIIYFSPDFLLTIKDFS